jgi:tetratricopeptide repeat domain protein
MRGCKIFIIISILAFGSILADDSFDILKAMYLSDQQPKEAIKIYQKLYKEKGLKSYLKEAIKVAYNSADEKLDELLKFGESRLEDDEDFWRIKILASLDKKELRGARNAAVRLIDINGSSKNHLLFGVVLSEANDLQNAIKEYKIAYELEKSDVNLLALAEFIDVKLGQRNEAISYLENSRKLNGCSEAVCLALVEIYTQNRQFEKLALVFEGLYDATKNSEYLDKELGVLFMLKHFDNAINLMKKYKYKEDEIPDLYAISGDFDGAIKAANEVYKATLNVVFKAKTAMYRYEKFGNKIDKQNLNEVVNDFEIAVKNSDNAIYQNYYGYILIEHEMDIKRGIELVKMALQKEPDSPYYLDSLAWGFYKLKECKKAYEIMQKAIKFDDKFANTAETKEHEMAIKKCMEQR